MTALTVSTNKVASGSITNVNTVSPEIVKMTPLVQTLLVNVLSATLVAPLVIVVDVPLLMDAPGAHTTENAKITALLVAFMTPTNARTPTVTTTPTRVVKLVPGKPVVSLKTTVVSKVASRVPQATVSTPQGNALVTLDVLPSMTAQVAHEPTTLLVMASANGKMVNVRTIAMVSAPVPLRTTNANIIKLVTTGSKIIRSFCKHRIDEKVIKSAVVREIAK